MIESSDLNLLTYVIRIRPHVKLCERLGVGVDLDPNNIYYYAIERETNDIIQINYTVIRVTEDIALAEIFETGKDAEIIGKTLTVQEATMATVHPVSRKIFFEASLKGLR